MKLGSDERLKWKIKNKMWVWGKIWNNYGSVFIRVLRYVLMYINIDLVVKKICSSVLKSIWFRDQQKRQPFPLRDGSCFEFTYFKAQNNRKDNNLSFLIVALVAGYPQLPVFGGTCIVQLIPRLGCRLDDRGIGVRFSAGKRNFSILQSSHTVSGAHSASYAMDTWGSFAEVKVSATWTTSFHVVQRLEWSEYYSHSPIRLRALVINWAKRQIYHIVV
jgi:hypothetical protein